MQKHEAILIRNAQPYDFGGGERFPVILAGILRKNGIDPLVVSRNPKLIEFARTQKLTVKRGLWWKNQNWSGWRVLLFPVYALWQLVLFIWYARLFVRVRPATVHVQSKDDFIAATYAGRLVGARVIWTDHADLKHVWKNLGVWYKNPIGKWIYQAAKHTHTITLVSKSEREKVALHLPGSSPIRDRLVVIYNGSEDSKSHYGDVKQNDAFTYCIVSRLVTDKGIGEAIRAFQQIHEKHEDTKLLLVGGGPEEDRFKNLAVDEPSILFVGHQPDPLPFVARSHVFVHPTYHEGFSLALVEASMMEVPIIATNVGGNPEIIKDGETGLLVPPKDITSLVEAMNHLYSDHSLRATLAKNARANYLNHFVFSDIVTRQFLPLYSKKENR